MLRLLLEARMNLKLYSFHFLDHDIKPEIVFPPHWLHAITFLRQVPSLTCTTTILLRVREFIGFQANRCVINYFGLDRAAPHPPTAPAA